MKRQTIIVSVLLAFLIVSAVGLIAPKVANSPVLDDLAETKTEGNLAETETSLVAESAGLDIPPAGEPAIAAGAYLISGQKLEGWKDEKRWPIASITKLLSSFVVLRVMDMDEAVNISARAVETVGGSGEFTAGESFRAGDLVEAMLLVSSNDAAVALAEHYGSQNFVSEMNAAARRAGMTNSRFVEPTGLSVENQATIEDLVRLVNYIWQEDRRVFEISRQSTEFMVDTNTGQVRQLVSINEFAGRPDFLGGKTGRLPEADGNLLSVFASPVHEEPIVIVVLGSADRFGETLEILNNL